MTPQELINNKRNFTLIKNGYAWQFDSIDSERYLYKAFVFLKGIKSNVPYVKEVSTISNLLKHLENPAFNGAKAINIY
jgi:hypothetical protein